jgi:hypothetical protein
MPDEYSTNSFYTGSRDKHGHATTLRVNIPPSVMNDLQELIASRRVAAYKTAQDFARDALIHRMKYLIDELDVYSLEQTWALWMINLSMDAALNRVQEQKACVSKLRQLAWEAQNDPRAKAMFYENYDRAIEQLDGIYLDEARRITTP